MKYAFIDCTRSCSTPAKAVGKAGYFGHATLTAQELIEELQDYDPDTNIILCTGEDEFRPIEAGSFSYEGDCYPENEEYA